MALRLLHRLRIFSAVFALPPAAAGGLSDDAFGAAANRLAASAYDEMQAWVRGGCGGGPCSGGSHRLARLLSPLLRRRPAAATVDPACCRLHC